MSHFQKEDIVMGNLGQIGRWAFIVGLVVAVLAGLIFNALWVTWVLVILGLIVGFLNVTGAESQAFLIAAIGLTISASAVQTLPLVGGLVTNILANVVIFISPAILVVAIKAVLETARA
jgi:hypothetical protein